MGSLIYSIKDGIAAIHIYIESTLRVPNTDIVVTQKTYLPWSGDVEIVVHDSTALALRIPAWADGYQCSANGEVKDGYLYLRPSENAVVKLTFKLEPRKVYANPKTGKNEVAVVRGPLVYCIEDVDNTVDVDHVYLTPEPLSDSMSMTIASVADVVPVIAKGKVITNVDELPLYGQRPGEYSERKDLTFIPHFLRANRGGRGSMRVWSPRLE